MLGAPRIDLGEGATHREIGAGVVHLLVDRLLQLERALQLRPQRLPTQRTYAIAKTPIASVGVPLLFLLRAVHGI